MTRGTRLNKFVFVTFLILISCGSSETPAPALAPVTPAVKSEKSHDAHAAGAHSHGADAHAKAAVWTCPMHPDVSSNAAGRCSICGMDLVELGKEPEKEDHMGRMMRVRGELKATLGAAYDLPVAGLAQADAKAGAKTYLDSCGPCHGSGGKGDGPLSASLDTAPADHTDPHHARYYSDAGRIEIIRSGIGGTPMLGFKSKLSEPELLDLYAYLAGLRNGGHGDHGSHKH